MVRLGCCPSRKIESLLRLADRRVVERGGAVRRGAFAPNPQSDEDQDQGTDSDAAPEPGPSDVGRPPPAPPGLLGGGFVGIRRRFETHGSISRISGLSRNDPAEVGMNHGWTRMDTDSCGVGFQKLRSLKGPAIATIGSRHESSSSVWVCVRLESKQSPCLMNYIGSTIGFPISRPPGSSVDAEGRRGIRRVNVLPPPSMLFH